MGSSLPPSYVEEVLSHAKWVRNFAASLVGEHMADENAQEAIFRAIKSPPRHNANIQAWLKVVTRNVVFEFQRKEKAREQWLDRAPESGYTDVSQAPSPEEASSRNEATHALLAAIDRLPETDRLLVLGRYQEDVSLPVLAAQHGLTERAARNRIDRAKERVRVMLDDDFGFGGMLPCLALLPAGTRISSLTASTAAASSASASTTSAWANLIPYFAIAAVVAVGGSFLLEFLGLGNAENSIESSSLEASSPFVEDGTDLGPVGDREEVIAATPASGSNFVLTLRTLSTDGAPIESTSLTVLPQDSFKAGNANHPLSEREGALSYVSNQQGIIEIPLSSSDATLRIASGSPVLRLANPNVRVDPSLGPSDHPIDIELLEAASLTGQVVDAHAQPVSGAKIQCIVLNGDWSPYGRLAESNEQGEFSVHQVLPGREYALRISAPGRSTHVESISVMEAGRHQLSPVRLEPGLEIVGTALDAEGQPVPDVRIHVVSESQFQERSRRHENPRASSDAGMMTLEDGSFVCPAVQPGSRLVATSARLGFTSSEPIQANQGSVQLSFAAGLPPLRFRATLNGQLAREVQLTLRGPGANGRATHGLPLIADSDGVFTHSFYPDEPSGDWTIALATEHGSTLVSSVQLPQNSEVLDFDLESQYPIELTVWDAFEHPWPGLEYRINTMGLSELLPARLGVTDDQGKIRANLPSGSYYLLIQDPSTGWEKFDRLEVGNRPIKEDIRSQSHHYQAIVAKTVDGEPLRSRKLNVVQGSEFLETRDTDIQGIARLTTRAEPVQVRLLGDSMNPDTSPYVAAQLDAWIEGDPVANLVFPSLLDLEIELDTPEGYGEVHELLLIGDAQRELAGDLLNPHMGSEYPIKNCRATVQDLPPGHYWIVLPQWGARPSAALSFELSPANTRAVLSVGSLELEGRLVGESIPYDCHVQLLRPVSEDRGPTHQVVAEAPVTQAGQFSFKHVEAGDWIVRLAPGSSWSCQPVAITASLQGMPQVELELESAAEFQVTGLNLKFWKLVDNAPMQAVSLRHRDSGVWFALRNNKTSTGERYASMPGLPAGAYDYWIKGERQPGEVELMGSEVLTTPLQ